MAGPLTTLCADLERVLEDDSARHAAGGAAKEAALKVAEEDLGADRAMSGFRRKIPLKAGYDMTTRGVDLNLYPEGLWTLAQDGRKASSKKIIPRKGRRGRGRRRRRVAVLTPQGPRYSARITASRPMRSVDRVGEALPDAVGDALDEHLLTKLSAV